jgi:cytochrome c biogenesis protein CcmG/thiol:disulfide interchange protein DsbE
MTARRQISIAGLAAVLVIALVAAGKELLRNELAPAGVGAEAPPFRAMTLDSIPRAKTLDDYRGKVVLINLWATWCVPCRVEMPGIEALYRSYSARGLNVVAISVDDPGAEPEIRSFVKQYGLTFEVLHDPLGQEGRISRDYQTNGYPQTVIVGRDGIIRRKFLGAHNWNSAENRALIDRLLADRGD